MKPKDLIRQTLAEKIEPVLSEFDFTFFKSSLKFVRKYGDFRQEINTHLDRHNREDFSVEFYFSFTVGSNIYSKWHLSEYGKKVNNDCLASEMYWNLRGWKYTKPDVAHIKNLEKEMRELLEDTLSVGLPFLEKYSDWENAANRFVKQKWLHEKACDFYLIVGNKEKAYWVLTEALKCWNQYPKRTFFGGEKEAIKLRFSKHFGEQINLENFN